MILRGNMERGATFSECDRYRYRLWRRLKPPAVSNAIRTCMFLMLNPSTADENVNDPTVERCERRAREAGFEYVQVMNIFAWRSTDPRGLRLAVDPVGPENSRLIVEDARSITLVGGIVICAWGQHGKLMGQGDKMRHTLRLAGVPLHCLKLSRDGTPAHPLYLSYDLKPQEWN